VALILSEDGKNSETIGGAHIEDNRTSACRPSGVWAASSARESSPALSARDRKFRTAAATREDSRGAWIPEGARDNLAGSKLSAPASAALSARAKSLWRSINSEVAALIPKMMTRQRTTAPPKRGSMLPLSFTRHRHRLTPDQRLPTPPTGSLRPMAQE